MPTFYAPGTRKGNRTYVVRGRIDGREYEIVTNALHKRGEEGAVAFWERFAARIRERAGERRGECGEQRDESGRGPRPPSFRDAKLAYERSRDLSRNEGRYVDRLEGARLPSFGATLGEVPVAEVTLAHIAEAAAALYPAAKPQTRNRQAYAPAAAILHYAAKLGWRDWLVVEKLEETDPLRPVAYPEAVQPLVRAAADPRVAACLLTLQRQGWRITETLMVRREHVDVKRKRVLRWVTKRRKWIWSAVAPEVLAAWKKLPQRADGFLFPWRDRHNFYRALRADKALAKRLEKAAWTPHMSRRGLATTLIEEGADLKSIMETVGWADLKSVLPYAQVDFDQAQRTLARVRGRLRGKAGKRGKSAA